MQTFSFGTDGFINLWQILVLAGILGVVTIFIPWLMGLQFRLAGKRPPHFSTTAGRCLVCCGATIAIAIIMLILCLAAIEPLLRTIDIHIEGGAGIFLWLVLNLVLSLLANYRILRAKTLCGDVLTKGFVIKCSAAILILTLAGWMVCLHSLRQMRVGGQMAATGANLRSIATGLELYQERYKIFPADIRLPSAAGYVSMMSYYSVLSSKEMPGGVISSLDWPIGFNYIPLTGDAPGDLILLWDDPENYDSGSPYVLYKGGQVKMLTPAELSRDLARTYEWMLSRRSAASQPASQPTSLPTSRAK